MSSQDNALPQEYAPGYSNFASILAASKNRSCMIFRRFDKVNTRNLLILESQIAELEARLEALETEGTEPELAASLSDWALLESQAETHKDDYVRAKAKELIEVTRAIDMALEKYYGALSRTKEIMAMSLPGPKEMDLTREMFKRPSGRRMIQGALGNHLKPHYENDLSLLTSQDDCDNLSLILGRIYGFFNPVKSVITARSRVCFAVSTISGLAATIFLVTAVVALYFISSPEARLGTLCGFTILFASTLAIFTNAKRHEIFVATAAYAAVLVVFVSGNLASNTTNYYPTSSSGANPQPANALETVTLIATETVAAITETATATATVTLSGIQTVYPTACASPSPCATSAAVKGRGGWNGMSTATKAGIGLGIACAAAFGLLILTLLFIGAWGVCMAVAAVVNKWWMSWFNKRTELSV